MPPQCYRCQEFYHHSRFCNRAPRCLKCSGCHLTSDCKKPNKAPAKCANCSGPHPANFSGCPQNPKKQRKQQQETTNEKRLAGETRSARSELHTSATTVLCCS
ncbi:nucleic-acid-binding protein from transposon X-element [Trichonephila clavipes]|nr:nucleic-acid-binding protein from transposon X-element [Trichonephila clavipes]